MLMVPGLAFDFDPALFNGMIYVSPFMAAQSELGNGPTDAELRPAQVGLGERLTGVSGQHPYNSTVATATLNCRSLPVNTVSQQAGLADENRMPDETVNVMRENPVPVVT